MLSNRVNSSNHCIPLATHKDRPMSVSLGPFLRVDSLWIRCVPDGGVPELR